MKVLSLNANKGLIKHMGDLQEADVVLSQEPYPHAEDRSEDASLLFPELSFYGDAILADTLQRTPRGTCTFQST